MTKSFYAQSSEFRNEALQLLSQIDMPALYLKSSYKGEYQEISITGATITLTIRQERLYKNIYQYKTNTIGDKIIIMTDSFDNSSEYKYDDFIKIIEWEFPERDFRLIIPSSLLTTIKTFVAAAIERGLPSKSTNTEQIIYYTSDAYGEVAYLMGLFPQIINQNKPIQ